MLTIFYNHILEAMKQENMTLKEVASIAKRHGIQGLEMDYRDLNPSGIAFNKKLAKEVEDAGLPIYGVYVFFDWGAHPFDNSYKKIYKDIAGIGVKKSLAIPGMIPEGADSNKYKRRMLRKLTKAVEYAKKLGVEVLMEDFDGKEAPFSTSEGMKYFFNGIPDLKCAFDTGNFYYSDEDALKLLPDFLDKITYVHCKDRSLEAKPGEEPKKTVSNIAMYSSAVGEGIIPIDEIIRLLLEHGYQGDFAIEHFGSMHQLQDMLSSADFINSILKEDREKTY